MQGHSTCTDYTSNCEVLNLLILPMKVSPLTVKSKGGRVLCSDGLSFLLCSNSYVPVETQEGVWDSSDSLGFFFPTKPEK